MSDTLKLERLAYEDYTQGTMRWTEHHHPEHVRRYGSSCTKGDRRVSDRGGSVREQSLRQHLQGRLSRRKPGVDPSPSSRRVARVCKRPIRVRIPLSRGYGRDSRKDLVYDGRRRLRAQNMVWKIRTARRDPLRPTRHIGVNLLHTLALDNEMGVKIQSTIAKIERDRMAAARSAWKKRNKSEPYGVFVTKIDVSNVSINELQKALPQIQRSLHSFGCGLYSIDYTHDFSTALDRKALVEHQCKAHGFRVKRKTTTDGTSTTRPSRPTRSR